MFLQATTPYAIGAEKTEWTNFFLVIFCAVLMGLVMKLVQETGILQKQLTGSDYRL